MPQQRKT
jgi:transposase-like protein